MKICWDNLEGIYSKETLEKMSIARKGQHKGMTHYNWNKNLTTKDREIGRNYPEYTEWRSAVYSRDNFTCVCCDDSTGGNLVAHHVESYADNPDLRIELENGITLCEECHKDFHHNFGYGNNNKKQLYYFLLERKGD